MRADPIVTEQDVHPWIAEGQRRIRFGLAFGPTHQNWPRLRDFVQMVEDLGFDSYWCYDHPVFNRDCWISLTAVSAATTKIRLGSLISCVFYRNPALLARLAADADHLSGGRLVLGVGLGDFAWEFKNLGIAWPSPGQRQAALEDALIILHGLLRSNQPFTHRGSYFSVDEATLTPGPVQSRIPILLAGGGERTTLRQVARYADMSNLGENRVTGGARHPADVRRKYEILRGHCNEQGRPYDAILRSHIQFYLLLSETAVGVQAKLDKLLPYARTLTKDSIIAVTPREAIAYYQALIDAGVQYFIPAIYGNDEETVELLAKKVIPELPASAPTVA